jgi:hypothetical protein
MYRLHKRSKLWGTAAVILFGIFGWVVWHRPGYFQGIKVGDLKWAMWGFGCVAAAYFDIRERRNALVALVIAYALATVLGFALGDSALYVAATLLSFWIVLRYGVGYIFGFEKTRGRS